MLKFLRKLLYSLPVKIRIPLLKKVSLLYYDAGLGDTLLVAAVAREIKKKYGEKIKITVNCAKQDLLKNNPYINNISNRYDGIDLNYHYGKHRSTNHFDTNLIDIMCNKVGITKPEHSVDLFLSDEEISNAKSILADVNLPFITLQTTSGFFDAGRKLWPDEYWKKLIDHLKNENITIVQLGGKEDIPIDGTINLINKLSIRESAAIISLAELHIGIVSSLMHIAEAVNTKAIILFGGFERYGAHDYNHITPIESNIDCSPCGLINTKMTPCTNDMKCMREISPEIVIRKIRSIINMEKLSHA